MTETNPSAVRTPKHLWVIGIVSLFWNAMGALDFTMTQLNSGVWLKSFTPEQVAYIKGFPGWSLAAWGIATWSSLIGSLLLLLRKGVAVPVLLVSLVAMVLTTIYSFVLSDGVKIMGGGAGMIVFNATIFVISVLLLLYAKAMRKRGVLR